MVQVTVIPGPRGRAIRDRIGHVRGAVDARLVLVVAVALAGLGVVAAGQTQGGRTGSHPDATVNSARASAPSRVAAAFRYPLGCLSVTISASDPAYAAARLDRASPCWRYGVYLTAVFHRVDGVWGLVLEAASPRCPIVSLPAVVQSQLAICRRIDAPPPAHRRAAAPHSDAHAPNSARAAAIPSGT